MRQDRIWREIFVTKFDQAECAVIFDPEKAHEAKTVSQH
jgi:hypothetical protein